MDLPRRRDQVARLSFIALKHHLITIRKKGYKMAKTNERNEAVTQTVNRIRELARGKAIDPAVLEEIKEELLFLATKKNLFSFQDFPSPEKAQKRRSCLYRLSEDDDHGFALYVNSADGAVKAPPHDHTTWAVIVGVHGQEENRFYKKVDAGVEQIGAQIVENGTGVVLMPDDIHTIHIDAGAPVLNFHMYGLGLEQLHGRNFWNRNKEIWEVFPAHTDIREARA
jgi:predicted metal-dependent enzyme (double-stranded beta helix superfamily)